MRGGHITDGKGRIVSFYSYKGGTGRSMALADVALLLVRQGKSVLAIDWDLEAPGLHRYFEHGESRPGPGLIELFQQLHRRVLRNKGRPSSQLLDEKVVDQFVCRDVLEGIDLLKAGDFASGYAENVRGFQWQTLFSLAPTIFTVLAEFFTSRYDFVLIDSRTGVTDTSGICTCLMPEILVAVFTPNRQSIEGLIGEIEHALEYRAGSPDPRNLLVLPLASRIETTYPALCHSWRHGVPGRRRGYQDQFADLFKRCYQIEQCDLQRYFDDIQIQYIPEYSFGEQIPSLLADRGRFSLDTSYTLLTKRIVAGQRPWSELNDSTRYLEALWEETAYIDIRGLRVGNEAVHRLPIDQLYTPLTTVLAPEEQVEKQRKAEDPTVGQRDVPLQMALENRCIVLVGDPGAGKTTFLRRIAFAACETLLGKNALAAAELLPVQPCPLPLLVRAASLANFIAAGTSAERDSPGWICSFLEHATGENNCALDAAFFRRQLNDGCLLLLDGLDEVSTQTARQSVARLLERLARVYPKTHVVATSRPPAYGGQTVIPGFVTIQIGPLEDEAMQTFVANWCRALHGDAAQAERHQAELLDAIHSRPDIEALAVNPVMLTALAALHWNQTRLPDQRSELYDSVLDWLAKARQQAPGRMSPVECLAMMQHLAYTMHSDPKGRQTEITRHAAARVLAARFRDVPDEADRIAAAADFLENEETDSGILVSRGNTLRFWHLTFQEYLAARALAWRDEDRRRLLFTEQKLYRPEWRETVLLLSGVLCKQDPERVDAFFQEMLDGIGPAATLAERAQCVGLIGRALQDLKSWGYQITDPRYHENLDRAMAIFDPATARQVDFKARLEAADALGQAGDPRLDLNHSDYWVRIPGGVFWMGAQKSDRKGRNYDSEAYDDESPVHQVEVRGFEMGRYLVTVFNYQKFVEEGGYDTKEFWAAGGFGKFKEPGRWRQQLRHSNRPVVEVSWYEATAYCAWSGGRLPSEGEWECAARGGREGVRYPWGRDVPDAQRANYGEKGPGHLTPVGLYPEGATPEGIQDLAGNCYEWVWDRYRKYNENADGDTNVIRGGAWPYYARSLRTSYRNSLLPDQRMFYLGFRCVREYLPL